MYILKNGVLFTKYVLRVIFFDKLLVLCSITTFFLRNSLLAICFPLCWNVKTLIIKKKNLFGQSLHLFKNYEILSIIVLDSKVY